MSDLKNIGIENALSIGRTKPIDRQKYEAFGIHCSAILSQAVLTDAEAKQVLMPHLPETLFSGGDKPGWWSGVVRLDLKPRASSSGNTQSQALPSSGLASESTVRLSGGKSANRCHAPSIGDAASFQAGFLELSTRQDRTNFALGVSR